MANYGAINRATTEKIKDLSSATGTSVRIAGCLQAAVWISFGAALIWYSTTIAETCSAPQLHIVYLAIGITHCVYGCLGLVAAANAGTPADLTQHFLLATKYEQEHRTEEAKQQQEQMQQDLKPYTILAASTCCGGCICFFTVVFLLVWGSTMLPQATSGCGNASNVFALVLGAHFAVMLLMCCIQGCNQMTMQKDLTATMQAPPRREPGAVDPSLVACDEEGSRHGWAAEAAQTLSPP
eukprot:CAMPEP_0204464604 /NCGR_PEP_ID=MMETSP0471-20130131/7752_1 /ASSEMBLY_ACC=CAM_ASM_000602 /TAXON_ID=2969 /ORGANISM="Oxyrrhis marina" /LENGTH=238 /DNA_ID=CAMNT_0051466037 /DNA_START=33 /DNA_END=746 /DNA_ORIENTATION=-